VFYKYLLHELDGSDAEAHCAVLIEPGETIVIGPVDGCASST
jgi:hypothetical protein